MLKWLISILLLFCLQKIYSQQTTLKKITGLPTEEVYNIYPGSKGNIWVAHSLGLSRFDGHAFTHFVPPDGSPLGVTNICEDLQGRIWCHDFNGTIYYVEHEKMKIFNNYKPGPGEAFPVIIIADSELVITTAKGLYVCNTHTLNGVFYNVINKPIFSKSIAICGKSIISYDRLGAYKYQKGKGLIPIATVGPDGKKYNEVLRGFNLANIQTKDTMYGFNNYDVFTLIERNDSLKIIKIEKSLGMVNTITLSNGKVWINTKKCSYTINKKEIIYNRNLTDIIVDKYGNKWYSSLQDGLSVEISYKGWERTGLPFLKEHDFIRSMVTLDDNTIYGTESGQVIITKNNKVLQKFTLPSSSGAAEKIFITPNKSLLIAPSVGLYYYKLMSKSLYMLSNMATYKAISITDTTFLIAVSGGLLKLPLTDKIYNLIISTDPIQNSIPHINELTNLLKSRLEYLKTVFLSRCSLISYDSISKKTFAIFKEGLAEVKGDNISFIKENNKQIEASCLIQKNGITYIGTLNEGLLKYTQGNIEKISIINGLFSKTILNMKLFNDQIYLVEQGYFQVYDLKTKRFIITIPLPDNTGNVHDFTIKKDIVYLTFTNYVYKLETTNMQMFTPIAYILSATALISHKSIFENNRLSYDDNNIQINLSSPSFNYPEATYFIYRLKGSYDTSWKKLEGPVYNVFFQSLKPGNYSFEAYAFNFQNARSNNTLIINFSIKKPWWQSWWFFLIALCFFSLILVFFLTRYYKRIKKENQLAIDKLTLQNSLRKTLLRTITAQMNPHFIFNAMNTIQSYVYRNDKRSASNYLGKFSELIRKILDTSNIDTITLQEEIEILKLYLELEKARFEENFNVTLEIDPGLLPEQIEVPPMFIQPYIENAIKHGLLHKKGPRILLISIGIDPEKSDYIRIIVDDNGIGRHRSMELNSNMKKKHKSFASSANENRVDLINHTLDRKIYLNIIDKQKDSGTVVIIQLPIINNIYD